MIRDSHSRNGNHYLESTALGTKRHRYKEVISASYEEQRGTIFKKASSSKELDKLMLDGIACRGTARGDIQLTINRAHVGLNGKQTNNEPFGDLSIG